MLKRGLFALLILFSVNIAIADENLIREVESLRSSLPIGDRSRPDLTARLADLYFYEAQAIAKKIDLGQSADDKKLGLFRKKAAAFYEEMLSGVKGSAAVGGDLKIKTQFQLARLYADMNLATQARTLFASLAAQSAQIAIKREAALRMAEDLESAGTSSGYSQAGAYYDMVIQNCAQGDVCSYAHYRKAWLYRNQGKIGDAINEIQLGLWDSKRQVREEALRDLIVFCGADAADVTGRIALIESLGEKLGRKNLIKDLSNAYFSSGHRAQGTEALAYFDARHPNILNQIVLAEEYYGLRDWAKLREYTAKISALDAGVKLADSERIDGEKLLRRLTIQLDGERASRAEFLADFLETVKIYLNFFVTSPDRFKMMEGWLAAAVDPEMKSNQIKSWLTDSRYQLSSDQRIKLLEMRASIAQKKNDYQTVAQEMAALAGLAADGAKKREYRYIRARSLYELKIYDEAIQEFTDLARVDGNPARADQWAVQSQNLALDIYSQRKDYGKLITQGQLWISVDALKKEQRLQKELGEMSEIVSEARFEMAASLGTTAEALSIFKDFCLSKKYLPKSCDNAKSLAVRLKDEASLITVLKAQGDEEGLLAEYEAAGFFGDAAQIFEKRNIQKSGVNSDVVTLLKGAVLYELAWNNAERDRVLAVLIRKAERMKSMGAEEPAIYKTLGDASLLNVNALRLPWSQDVRAQLANDLEQAQAGSAETKKILLSTQKYAGEAWANLVLDELIKLDAAQRKISFYGKKAKKNFEMRLSEINKLAQRSDFYLEQSDPVTRVKILSLLMRAYSGFSNEIMMSPIPEGLDELAVVEIKGSLAQMATPFQEKARAYYDLSQIQIEKVTDQGVKSQLMMLTQSKDAPIKVSFAQATKPTVFVKASEDYRAALKRLNANPTDLKALQAIKGFYESAGSSRLAYYFSGRISSVGGGK